MNPNFTFKTIADHIISVLEGDDFDTFVKGEFDDKSLFVAYGYVQGAAPSIEQCPHVVIVPLSANLAQNAEIYQWQFAVDFTLKCTDIERTTNKERVKALDQLDKLWERFVDDLEKSLKTHNAWLSSFGMAIDDDTQRILSARGDLQFSITNTLGPHSINF